MKNENLLSNAYRDDYDEADMNPFEIEAMDRMAQTIKTGMTRIAKALGKKSLDRETVAKIIGAFLEDSPELMNDLEVRKGIKELQERNANKDLL